MSARRIGRRTPSSTAAASRPAGNRDQQISRPVADTQPLDDAIGRVGAGQDECAVREIDDAGGLVDDHDSDRREGVDGPELQAADNDHHELGNHLRSLRQDAKPTTRQLPLMMRALATFLLPW